MKDALIEVKNISKTFKVRQKGKSIKDFFVPKYTKKKAVKCINFSIKKGEIVGFIGKNGAGKSTTIKMLSGILYPDSGDINVAGFIPYKQRKQYVSNIGVVFRQAQLSWDLPLMDSFDLIRQIYKIPKDIYQKNLNKFINLLDMKDFLYQQVRQLSLGQRMKGDIVAALLHSPKIVFFDEPTIDLDVVAKENIREFIKYLNKSEDITMIFTTHDMQDIEKVCERLIIIDSGRKVYDGTVKEIKDFPEYNGSKKSFKLDTRKVDINDLMNKIILNHNIKDISIKEPDIDEIIRGIYEGELKVI